MTKQMQMFVMLGLGGAVAWLCYRNYQMKKNAEAASLAAQDAAALSANGEKDLATTAALQAAELSMKANPRYVSPPGGWGAAAEARAAYALA